MTCLFPDTPLEIEAIQLELLHKAPVWRKMEMVGQMNETVKTMALLGLRNPHPDASDEELFRRLADILPGPELAAKVYGPLAEKNEIIDAVCHRHKTEIQEK